MKNRLNNIILTEDSSFVQNVSYDPKLNNGTLQLVLNSGTWRYYLVTPATFSEFITRTSTGKAYNSLIKGKFKSRRMRNKVVTTSLYLEPLA